ncbi:lytic polysaccharide monooxygenase auxiliary activity family 9 protein [Embleya sp. NPDC008237]|uniref:lytic polysaccharide monooxygenase auxiliary activity family 9 protein n=1 Tax=Embleya sp. NPDC008237 TaxID=3363978 RepID=UPI0036EFF31A
MDTHHDSTHPRGAVVSPPSRAAIYLLPAEARCLVAGKHFPLEAAGRDDPHTDSAPFRGDAPNNPPPEDGAIASCGSPQARLLDKIHDDRCATEVYANQTLPFVWELDAPYPVRRFNYFITRTGWDPAQALSRAQFEATPFATLVTPGTATECRRAGVQELHEITLPARLPGHHVVLAVCEFADTGDALYQAVDLRFVPYTGRS